MEIKAELRDIKLMMNQNPSIASISSNNVPRNDNMCMRENNGVSKSFAQTLRGESGDIINTFPRKHPVNSQNSLQNGRSLPRISVNNVSNSQLQDSNVNSRQTAAQSTNNSSSTTAHTPWTVVKNKRTRNTMTGQKKNVAGNFKAVQQTRDVYVGRCDPSVDAQSIENYVHSEFNFSLLKCISISNENSEVKAFKVTVLAQHSEIMLDATKWPEDIRIRKFYNRSSNQNGHEQQ